MDDNLASSNAPRHGAIPSLIYKHSSMPPPSETDWDSTLELQNAGWTEYTQSAGLAYPFRDRREEMGLPANIRLATGKTCAATQASHVAARRSIVHHSAQQIVRSG